MQAEEAAEVEANPAVADGAADDEDGGAILEEQAEMQTSGDNTDAEPEAKAAEDEARESWRAGGEEALMHGSVSSSEAALDGEGTLRFYFEIDPSLYPISVDSLCLYNTSESGDGAFLFEIPLDTAARNSGAPFWLSWKREMRAAQTGREAENKNVGFCAKAAGLKSAAVTLEAVLDLQEVPSDIPQQFVVSYYTGSDPFVRVKTLKLADNDYFYDPENNAVQICLTETAPSPEIHVLSVNDLTNNLTYNEAMDFSGFDGGDDGDVMGDAIEISYSSFDLGFTQSPTVCVVNIPTANEADKFRNSYISSHAESLNSGAAYNRRSGVFEADGVINDGTGYTVYWRLNFVCADKYDDIVLTGLEGSESRWQGFSRCWYGCGNLLSLDYNGFAADRAAAESDIGIIGKIIINNIDAQPSLGRIKYCRGADGPETTAEVLKGAVFDKEAKTLAAFVDLASASGEADDIVVKEITLDDYVCSGYITLCPAARIQSVSFSQFAKNGASGGADGLKRAYVRIVDLPFNPDTFRAVYTVGGGSEEKTVNIASYKDGALTFGGIITDASYITLKRIEVAAYVFNADRRIDLSGGVCREALLFGGFVRNGAMLKNYEVTVSGVPSYGSGKAKYCRGDSYVGAVCAEGSYSPADKKVTFIIPEFRSFISLDKIVVNNHYKYVDSKIKDNFSIAYGDMSAESVSCCQSVSGVSAKPNSARLSYVLYNDSSRTYTVSGTYDASAQTVNFRFKAKEDVKVASIVVNGKLYSKGVSLTYPNPNSTIKYANMFSTRLIVKNVPQAANYIMVKYKLYNSKTVASSSTYSKTAGTYSSVNQTYTFPFTLSALNGSAYDTVAVKSVALNNSVSTAERIISLGKTYNLLYSGLKAQNTRYSVNVYSGTSGVCGKTGTMKYTLNGAAYSAKGTVKYDSDKGRYVMHFETLKTTAASVKINKVTVGNKYYGSSFTLKYGQNKANSAAIEGLETINTRTLNMASGFKS